MKYELLSLANSVILYFLWDKIFTSNKDKYIRFLLPYLWGLFTLANIAYITAKLLIKLL